MFLIPIGHDRSIRSLPWLTIAIMMVCLLVQVYRTRVEIRSDELERLIVQVDRRMTELRGQGVTVEVADLDHAEDEDLRSLVAEVRKEQRRDPAIAWGFRPSDPWSPNIILYAFVHGGWLHLLGNMLFLWLVGCNLEDRWGRLRFGAFYLVGAAASAGAYALWHSGENAPLVGASGAIAAAMGAFLVYCHSASIMFWYLIVLPPLFKRGSFEARALYVMPLWFLQQVFWSHFEANGDSDGTAYSAHVGGFVVGSALALLFRWREGGAPAKPRRSIPTVDERASRAYTAAMAYLAGGHKERAIDSLKRALAADPTHEGALKELRKLDAPISLDLPPGDQ